MFNIWSNSTVTIQKHFCRENKYAIKRNKIALETSGGIEDIHLQIHTTVNPWQHKHIAQAKYLIKKKTFRENIRK